MKASSKYILFLLISTIFFLSYVHSQTSDSCNSPLNLPFPFDTTSLNCTTVWGDQGFILRYAQAGPNVWSFLLSTPYKNAYIAMGFSPNGKMVGSSAIVGWVDIDGTPNMKKYFLGGQSPNLVKVDNQSLQIANSSMFFQSNQIYMGFQVLMDTPNSRLIYAVGPQGRFPARPNFQLFQHDNMISTVLNYATGTFKTEKAPEAKLKKTHGLLNMLGWAVLMPIGAMVARYARQWDPLWFYTHISIQSIGFILGLSGVICGFVLEHRLKPNVKTHKGIGVFILVLGCLQVIAFLIRPNKESKVRIYWNWYHFTVGRLLIFLAAVNVFVGIHLGKAGTGWNAGFAIVLVILFIITLILEIRLYSRR